MPLRDPFDHDFAPDGSNDQMVFGTPVEHTQVSVASVKDADDNGPPNAVVLYLTLDDLPVFVVMRSKRAVDDVIAALVRNREFVWPWELN